MANERAIKDQMVGIEGNALDTSHQRVSSRLGDINRLSGPGRPVEDLEHGDSRTVVITSKATRDDKSS